MSDASIRIVGLSAGGKPGSVRLRLGGHVGVPTHMEYAFNLPGRGLQLVLEDLGTPAPTRIWSLLSADQGAVPAGAPGAGCDPRDGWKDLPGRASSVGFGYTNRSNALPPTCADGSARGLRRLRLAGRPTRLALAVQAANVEFALPGMLAPIGPLRLTAALGTSPSGNPLCVTYSWRTCRLVGKRYLCR